MELVSVLASYRSTPERVRLAWYIATSACWSSSSRELPSVGARATPMLARTSSWTSRALNPVEDRMPSTRLASFIAVSAARGGG